MKISNQEKQKLRVPDFIRLFRFAQKVSKEIGKKKALAILEQFIIDNRLNWLKLNRKRIKKTKNPIADTIRIFYRLNQCLDLKDAEITKKTDRILITRWHNFCPVLAACKALNLDTRQICKNIYHKPNQIFLAKIHPKLKFSRNYKKIRPYTNYCEEIIELRK